MQVSSHRSPRSICILRLSAIGDVCHVVPVVRVIQKQLPSVKITWIINRLEYTLVSGLKDVEFIVYDKNGGFQAIHQLRTALQHRCFDSLLHMQVSARANLLSVLVKSATRIGWDKPRWRDRHQWFINQSVRSVKQQHQVDAFLEFARALGLPADPPEWNLPIAKQDMAWATQQLGTGAPILMISPCSRHPLRNWASVRYARVADHAIAKLGMRVALVGGSSSFEIKTGQDIEAAMQHPALNLIGKDTINQSLALLKLATVVLSPDSGPVHLASAVSTPVIGLYAATSSQRSGPYRSLDLCVDKYTEAAKTFRHKDPQQLRWGQRIEFPGVMDLIQTGDVLEKLDTFMQKVNRAGAQ